MPADQPTQPQGCTNFKIRQIMRLVSQQYDAELGKTGLKTTQYSLLAHVERLGPIRPGELAQAMRLDASTLTRNLKPLVDAGWLRIEAGTDDRSRSVIITDAGRAKRAEAKSYWKAAQDKINRTLGVERVLALHALIDDSLALLSTSDQGAENE
ncbi:MAG TPA: MarR family winged helix-turn-helix transcriptional regulator [Noviherbaspirillum sp.]|jgi:DNA-binding MarR family transcriptional regulator|uniref:MarR family winged helix-turn-helix transcriptional regulator n=1 Tax=Noviherbaspirillum sp. TaxID=1926288 RepID=UPI002DDD76D4|nr:MarR family winged helix-turn-helix transcriptional regulator [Noviherbaspirillum sp.]HEV2610382.1 MarR family winged helix-turn-helix transcriptional regulator [Noviherbaspirillum sp.]